MNTYRQMGKDAIAQMTLEEKASLCSGESYWFTKPIAEKNIPQIRMCDGPSGLRFQTGEDDHLGVHASQAMTAFPTGAAMASSFDRNLYEMVGEALGQESRLMGVSIVLGPAMNIKRTPLCGRNFEYLSEDPFLSGKMAAAQVRGIQKGGAGACLKHYACNNQETRRMQANVQVDERTLREIYLAGFEIAVKESAPASVMAGYNKVNGEQASAHEFLLKKILKEEWGFEGYTVSDWGAVNDRVKALKAGLDLEMPGNGGITDRHILEALKDGTLTESVVDEALLRTLTQFYKYQCTRDKDLYDQEAHHRIAIEAAAGCGVLLKNEEDILPLDRNKKIVYCGEFAADPRFQGGGSACITPYRVVGAAEDAVNYSDIRYLPAFGSRGDTVNETWEQEALKAAGESDITVVFAGLPFNLESESYDRPHMRLPECQNRFLEKLTQVTENVVVVLTSGSPVEMPWIDKVKAVLLMHTGGEGVGEAANQLLFGTVNPSGHLAETYPLTLADCPAQLYFPGDKNNCRYAEGVFVGYRYYASAKKKVLFPFGHGLSYTSFQYSDLTVTKSGENETDLTVTVNVTNTGNCAGAAVAQLYIGKAPRKEAESIGDDALVLITTDDMSVNRPVIELKGFEKVMLQPAETKRLSFALNARSFAYYDVEESAWSYEKGDYRIILGESAEAICLETQVTLQGSCGMIRRPRSMETLMSELTADPKEWEYAVNALCEVSPKIDSFVHGTDDNSVYLTEELKELPFYAIRGLYCVPHEKLLEIIERLNKMSNRYH